MPGLGLVGGGKCGDKRFKKKKDEANPVRSNDLLSRIDLAMLANGGKDWRKEWCQCDPSVGYTPCEYCAIYIALKEAKDFIVNVR